VVNTQQTLRLYTTFNKSKKLHISFVRDCHYQVYVSEIHKENRIVVDVHSIIKHYGGVVVSRPVWRITSHVNTPNLELPLVTSYVNKPNLPLPPLNRREYGATLNLTLPCYCLQT
jgi:hypothetical protein